MKIVKSSYETIVFHPEEDMKCIERAARLCYKSESKIKEGSDKQIIKFLIDHGHEAMLEHSRLTVKFTVDRGVSHELVRHRLFSFAQESTRYCNYSFDRFGNEITVIEPSFYEDIPEEEKAEIRAIFNGEKQETAGFKVTDIHKRYANWYMGCQLAESSYFKLLQLGASAQEARALLPNSLKTEIVITGNWREWRHCLKLRTATDAHPDIRRVMSPLCDWLKTQVPIVFDDI